MREKEMRTASHCTGWGVKQVSEEFAEIKLLE